MNRQFIYNKKKQVVIFTDGACENNGQRNAVAGYGVWFGPNHFFNKANPVKGNQTSNDAEIQGCIKALRIAKGNNLPKVLIKTDSEFVKQCVEEWLPDWQDDKYIKPKILRKYEDYFKKLDDLEEHFDSYRVVHVPGHFGVQGNIEADRLAKLAVAKQYC